MKIKIGSIKTVNWWNVLYFGFMGAFTLVLFSGYWFDIKPGPENSYHAAFLWILGMSVYHLESLLKTYRNFKRPAFYSTREKAFMIFAHSAGFAAIAYLWFEYLRKITS